MPSYLLEIILEGKDQGATKLFDGLGSGLGTAAKAIGGIGLAVGGIALGGLTALGGAIASTIGPAMESQQVMAQLDSVLKSTGAAAAKQAKEWQDAQGKSVTTTRLSADALAALNKQLEETRLKHQTLGASIQEQKQRVIDLTQKYGDQGLAVQTAKAKLAEMQGKYDEMGGTIDQLADKVAKGGEKITTSLAGKLGLAPPVIRATKDEILGLADSFSKVTPFEDDMILKGENMLLTFTNIGKDVFPMATETMLDMSTALGQDLQSSAMQLGKALNDPVQGITALRRVGVNFTDSQEALIKKMVESGDVMGAQKLILQELQTEFGGSAKAAGETFAGKMEILKNSIGNVKESIGTAFLPVLTTLADKFTSFVTENGPQLQAFFQGIADWATNTLIPALVQIWDWLATNLPPAIQALGEFWTGTLQPALATIWTFVTTSLIPALTEIYNWLATNLPIAIQALSEFWTTTLQPALMTIWTFITESLIPALTEIWNWLATNIPPAIQTLADFWTTVLQPALQTIWDWISVNLIPILTTVAGWFTGEGTSSVTGWVTTIQTFLAPVIQFMSEQFAFIVNWVKQNWPLIQQTITTVMEAIRAVISTVMDVIRKIVETVLSAIRQFWQEHGDAIMTIVKKVWDIIKTTIETVIKVIAGIIKAIMQAINGDWSGAWETIKGVADTVMKGIQKVITDAMTIIQTIWNEAMKVIQDITGKVMRWLQDTIWAGFETINNTWRWAVNSVKAIWSGIADWAYGIGKSIVQGIKQGLIDFWDNLVRWIQKQINEIKELINELLSIGSPSKWAIGVGRNIMLGLAKGIEGGIRMPVTAIVQATGAVKEAGAFGETTTTNNYNLTIHTNAPAESALLDFRIMRALAGV